MKKIFLFYLLLFSFSALAVEDVYQFENHAQRNRFYHLMANFRCLVCQNETLADSNAPLAQDLREEIYQQIQEGSSDEQISDYLVGRYGEFILYKPAFHFRTFLLWTLPLLLLIVGLGSMIYHIKRQKRVV